MTYQTMAARPAPPFTAIACAVWALAEFGGWAALRGVGRLLVVFTAASFQAAGALDPSCFARQRRRHGWSVALFYAGHAALHLAPAAHALWWAPSAPLRARDLAAADLLFVAWAHLSSDRVLAGRRGAPPLTLDACYVPLRAPWMWHAAMLAGLGAQLAACACV